MTMRRNLAVIRFSVMAIVSLLIIEFLLGMWISLFAALPTGTTLAIGAQAFQGKLELGVHMIVGYLLSILSIVALVFASLSKKVRIVIFGILGVVSIIAAGITGTEFVDSGYTNNVASYTMSIAFLVGLLVYINLERLVSPPGKTQTSVTGSNANQASVQAFPDIGTD